MRVRVRVRLPVPVRVRVRYVRVYGGGWVGGCELSE